MSAHCSDYRPAFACTLVLGVLCPLTNCGEIVHLPNEMMGAFVNYLEAQRLVKALDMYRHAVPYEKFTVLQSLLPYLLEEKQCEIANYEWQADTHDLGRVAGRAALALDTIYGSHLPKVTPKSTKEDLQRVHAAASAFVEGYRAGVLDLARETSPARSLSELKAAYAQKIKPGSSDGNWVSYIGAMCQLFDEWFPIGKSVSDLAEIIGHKGEARKDGSVYSFFPSKEQFNGGAHFLILVKDGVIVGVLYEPIY